MAGMAGQQLLKRIPRIKFPSRRPVQNSSPQSTSPTNEIDGKVTKAPSLEIPHAPRNTTIGGRASIQPKRTPVSEKEIEAILLGGCF
eukprot:Gb_38529 [translate_table: standard]